MSKRIVNLTLTTTIDEEWERFLQDRRSYVCGKTIKAYISHYNALKRYFNPAAPMSEPVIQDLYRAIHNSTLKPTTQASYLKTLRAFVSFVGGISKPKIVQVEAPKDIYSDEEVAILTAALSNKEKTNFFYVRAYAATVLLVETGIRASTLLNLQPQDIDYQRKCFITRHNKNNKVQVVPFGEKSKTALQMLARFGIFNYVFVSQYGEQLTLNGLRSLIARYNAARGIKRNSIHAYRHYYARAFLKHSNNLVLLSKLMNHSSLEMTAHYARLYDSEIIDGYCSPLDYSPKRRKVIEN